LSEGKGTYKNILLTMMYGRKVIEEELPHIDTRVRKLSRLVVEQVSEG
jgi:hypothetical protein